MDLRQAKAELRREGLVRRAGQPDKDEVSKLICQRASRLRSIIRVDTILIYVSARSEVRTRGWIEEMLQVEDRVVVPWCEGDDLLLFHLQSPGDLAPGAFGIDEPRLALRNLPERIVLPSDVQAAIVPGVAFDVAGGRLGHGRGYYDRLLGKLRPGTPRIGLAYQCQVVPALPLAPHDALLDSVVTECGVYGRQRE
jgi:5-formyltetrahydrofolate cyclo-ligase